MMTTGSWMNRIREARPIRDVLGVILVAATALLYAAERHRAAEAAAPTENDSAVVIEPTEGGDLPSTTAVLETATEAPIVRLDRRG